MKKVIFFALLATSLFSCTDEPTTPDGTGDNTGDNKNYNTEFSYTIDGANFSSSNVSINFGGKTQINVLDGQGNLIADMSLPVKKDQTISGKAFVIDYSEFDGNANFYVDNEPYAMEGGSLNITKNEDEHVSGNFTGTAYKMDYSQTPAVKGAAVQVTNGVFTDIGN